MSAREGQPLLKVEGLRVRYESGRSIWGTPRYREVVHGVSFEVGYGRTVGLVGESGSGKSTIGKALLRQIPVLAGSILFEGKDMAAVAPTRTPLAYKRAVQVVFQNPLMSLNPRMLARETVAEAVRFHTGLDGEELSRRVGTLFDDVGLARRLGERYPRELSGGQQQRVAIARALASDPRLVICDEAVSALDVSTQAQVIGLLRRLQAERGVSYVFISHDLGIVRSLCHTVGVLRQGDLVEAGETEAIYRQPAHQYTRALLDAIPRLEPRRATSEATAS